MCIDLCGFECSDIIELSVGPLVLVLGLGEEDDVVCTGFGGEYADGVCFDSCVL